MADYQKFQLDMSMIQTLYQLTGSTANNDGDPILPTNPDTEVAGAVSSPDKTSKQSQVERNLRDRRPFYFTFSAYRISRLMWLCPTQRCRERMTCCLESARKRAIFEKAATKIQSESDLVNIIQSQRVLKFLSKLNLKKHQRTLVHCFPDYSLKNNSDLAYGELEFPLTMIPVRKQTKKLEMCYTPFDIEKLVLKAEAERSAIDRKILRKILLQSHDGGQKKG